MSFTFFKPSTAKVFTQAFASLALVTTTFKSVKTVDLGETNKELEDTRRLLLFTR